MGLARMWRRYFGKDKATFRRDEVIEAYTTAGTEFGSVASMIYMGECIGFEKLLDVWEKAERAYSDLGYRTLSIDDFVGMSWGHDIEPLVGVPRKEGEPEVFHAEYYRKTYLGKLGISETVVKAMQGEVAAGTYLVPTTEHLKQG